MSYPYLESECETWLLARYFEIQYLLLQLKDFNVGMSVISLRILVIQIPKLATAAEYFFKTGMMGKRIRPAVSI